MPLPTLRRFYVCISLTHTVCTQIRQTLCYVFRAYSLVFKLPVTCIPVGIFVTSKRSILNFVFSVLSLRLLGYISSLDIIIIIIFSTVAGDRPLTNQAWAYKITLFKPHVVSLVVGLFVLDITTCMWYSRATHLGTKHERVQKYRKTYCFLQRS